MKAAQIVTIKSFSPMFKDGEEARNIHIVNVEEHGFDIVAQKSLYTIGEKALFIEPDYCLSDLSIFQSYIAPEGDPKKSKLGKQNRIKAIKFNFTDTKGNKVYSNGILIPFQELDKQLDQLNQVAHHSLEEQLENLDGWLNITKYEEPEGKLNGDAKGSLPLGVYKTDETNFNKKIKDLEAILPCTLIGTTKIDGSSISIYYKNPQEYGITSRNLEKKLTTDSYPGFVKFYDRELQKQVWKKDDLIVEDIKQYFIDNNLVVEQRPANDDWVILGTPILEKLIEYNKPLVVRGEIYGQSLKGSGNKNNPHAILPKSIAVFGIDDYSSGVAIPLPMKEVDKICQELNLPFVNVVFIKQFTSIEETKDTCNEYFNNNFVEGLVIRSYDTNNYSAKYMHNEYDSRK